MPRDLIEIGADGQMCLNFHKGQWQAWNSQRRFVAVIAGTQSGKTSFGPLWLMREIQACGPGDYIVATPTFPLLELKALPEFQRLFETWLGLGKYTSGPTRRFGLSKAGSKRLFQDHYDPYIDTNIFFGYAADPDSLESATAKAAWLDEAGQRKFKLGSWEAILRRLSLSRGRALLTTTPYDLGWLKQKMWDRWQAGDPDIEVVSFESIANPRFSQEEFERAKRDLPTWKFELFYRGRFTRPGGLIYDSFDLLRHKCPRFAIPKEWPRYLGMDFGGVNTTGLFYAEDPVARRDDFIKLYLYREYKAGGRTAAEHAKEMLKGEPGVPTCVGGSLSEGQWRSEFRAGGLPVRPPATREVEVGIDRVYGAHKRAEITVFDDLGGYLEEKQTYSRKLDETGEPTEEIEDKSDFHFMDAERYIIGWLKRPNQREARAH